MVSSGHFEIFVSLLFLALSGECRKLKFPASFSFTDKRLKGHTIRTSQVPDIDICELLCYQEPNCVSINFKYEVRSVAGGSSYNCELNNSTHLGHDEDFVDAKGYVYRGAESACDKAPCENCGTCQAGFTEKGFRCLCPEYVTGIRCEHGVNSCHDLKMKGHSKGDGMYWLDPDEESHSNAFQAYCDMTSYNGGWTMCYTTDEYAKPRTEVKYNATFPYGTDGYRTNCNNIKFTEIMFIDQKTGRKAYFTRLDQTPITAAGNYGNKGSAHGLWKGVLTDGVGASNNTHFVYQLLICDHSFFSGFFVSGYTYCYKECNTWCGYDKSPYFRTASSSSGYKGVAFNENGHRSLSNMLISVGLR